MFEGTRLSYVVPGYTGHIPKTVHGQGAAYEEGKPANHIPGYAGYIQNMKAENLFGKTYGKITYQIQHGDYHQGQDVPPAIRYRSHLQDTYQDQNNVQLRTAANIVGVPARQYMFPIPQNESSQQFFQTVKGDTLGQSGFGTQQLPEGQQQNQSSGITTDPLRLGTPLPGYTGTQKRIVASNIFGQTFANARKSAINDHAKIQEERKANYDSQINNIPPLKR